MEETQITKNLVVRTNPNFIQQFANKSPEMLTSYIDIIVEQFYQDLKFETSNSKKAGIPKLNQLMIYNDREFRAKLLESFKSIQDIGSSIKNNEILIIIQRLLGQEQFAKWVKTFKDPNTIPRQDLITKMMELLDSEGEVLE